MARNDTIARRQVRTRLTDADLKRLVVRNDSGTLGSHQVKSVWLGQDSNGDLWIEAEVVD